MDQETAQVSGQGSGVLWTSGQSCNTYSLYYSTTSVDGTEE